MSESKHWSRNAEAPHRKLCSAVQAAVDHVPSGSRRVQSSPAVKAGCDAPHAVNAGAPEPFTQARTSLFPMSLNPIHAPVDDDGSAATNMVRLALTPAEAIMTKSASASVSDRQKSRAAVHAAPPATKRRRREVGSVYTRPQVLSGSNTQPWGHARLHTWPALGCGAPPVGSTYPGGQEHTAGAPICSLHTYGQPPLLVLHS